MNDPPATQPPPGTGPPAAYDPDPGFAAAMAGFDPGLHDPEPAALDHLTEPPCDEMDWQYPDDDGADDRAWLAALAADPGAAFTESAPLDVLAPGGALAGCAGHALDTLGLVSDDALIGLLRAARRVTAWQAGIEAAAVAELDRRRLRESRRPGWSKVSETIAAELAAALTLTGRAADHLLGFARDLTRLPAILAALLDGRIDRDRALVFAAELAALDDRAATIVAAELLPLAGTLTTGQLRHALRTLIHLFDPDAVRTRQHKARDQARVEAWQETSGNHALAGRELDPADALAASQRITAIARRLHAAGADGTLDQLRAAVFTALLNGRDPDTLLPQAHPAIPQVTGPDGSESAADPARPAGGTGTGPAPGSLAALGGSVHLTVPASTWLGLTDLPGEAAGTGPIDAWTSRDLADRLAAAGALARWCITLTRPDGTAAAHACARGGNGPPGDPAGRRNWLTRQTYTWLQDGRCLHAAQTPSYRPPSTTGDLVRARNCTCTFPGCRRPAARCDLDHTTPWHQGGRTCPCNLGPVCRQHHKTKQAPGWTLTQPQPGTMTWTAPHGRSYTVRPSTYIS